MPSTSDPEVSSQEIFRGAPGTLDQEHRDQGRAGPIGPLFALVLDVERFACLD